MDSFLWGLLQAFQRCDQKLGQTGPPCPAATLGWSGGFSLQQRRHAWVNAHLD